MSAGPEPPERFETEHLVARKPRVSDAPAVFAAYASDPEVTRYMSFAPYTEVGPLEAYLQGNLEDWGNGTVFNYMLCLKGTDEPVGSIGIDIEGFTAHFGYVLAKAHWGKGFMTEALSFLVGWALDQPEIYRATAICDAENPGSARVMEKAGMTFEGFQRRGHICPTLGPEPRDCRVYARVR